ncbi:MAG: phospholipase [Planctomyces sp.]|nr:phospholipase [Planctomyces sp.]
MQVHTFGPLNCRIVGNPESARLTVFFCHGYGAPGTDLVALGEELARLRDDFREKIAFVFPEAPTSLEAEGIPGGRAWWPINMAKLQQILQTRELEKLTKAEPPGMADMRKQFIAFLDEYRERYGVAIKDCILGGFSQGAMLTTEVTMHLPETPAGLCLYSGTLLVSEQWQELAKQKAGLPVFQSHGTVDPVLPFEAAEQLRDLLENAGLDVTFFPFPGPHTIPMPALSATVNMLAACLAARTES